MKIELGNNLEVLKNYPDNYFGSIVTDPPYGLSSKDTNEIIFNAFKRIFNIRFPYFDKSNSKTIKYFDFVRILNQISYLGRSEVFNIIKPFISMPESSVNFDSDIFTFNEEINICTESSVNSISNGILMDKINSNSFQYFGNYIFDFGDLIDFSISDIKSDILTLSVKCFL